jgi:hypothetical protein
MLLYSEIRISLLPNEKNVLCHEIFRKFESFIYITFINLADRIKLFPVTKVEKLTFEYKEIKKHSLRSY